MLWFILKTSDCCSIGKYSHNQGPFWWYWFSCRNGSTWGCTGFKRNHAVGQLDLRNTKVSLALELVLGNKVMSVAIGDSEFYNLWLFCYQEKGEDKMTWQGISLNSILRIMSASLCDGFSIWRISYLSYASKLAKKINILLKHTPEALVISRSFGQCQNSWYIIEQVLTPER